MNKLRRRRFTTILLVIFGLSFLVLQSDIQTTNLPATEFATDQAESSTISILETMPVGERDYSANYDRSQFGSGWRSEKGCDTRNIILNRDLDEVSTNDQCQVVSGVLNDPYTGNTIDFRRGSSSSSDVQIDHVVALSNAWKTGAQILTYDQRVEMANDPLELLAVSGSANQQKSDGDAAEWLPSNKAFRCQYVTRQIAVKQKYNLWLVEAEKQAMANVLKTCLD